MQRTRGVSIIVVAYTGSYPQQMLCFLQSVYKGYPISREVVRTQSSVIHWLVTTMHQPLWTDASLYTHDPRLWGPIVWRFMHWHARDYTVQSRDLYLRMLWGLDKLLPCESCGKNFRVLLERSRVLIRYKDQYIAFIRHLHTQVNAKHR
jgi:hypothetical protein